MLLSEEDFGGLFSGVLGGRVVVVPWAWRSGVATLQTPRQRRFTDANGHRVERTYELSFQFSSCFSVPGSSLVFLETFAS
jgi:hypothetical protein